MNYIDIKINVKNMFIDSHCHLNYPEIGGVEKAIAEAKANDVNILHSICTKPSEFEEIYGYCQYDNIYCSVGLHPCNVLQETITVEYITEICKRDKVIAIGETGLDYYYGKDSKQQQKESLLKHIKASQITQKPIIIHNRDADNDCYEILNSQYQKQPFPILIHCFTASHEFAKNIMAIGGYISLSGIITFNSAKDLQEIARQIPLNRILIETDSPYLAPVPYRGKSNKPAYTKYVAEKLAQLKNIDIKQVGEVTSQNFYELFKINK